ncbi:MAG: diguanylate cyclase [Nitrospirae bacterium]|nr:diguanylate cyclase [Nitrospirota bacterium]
MSFKSSPQIRFIVLLAAIIYAGEFAIMLLFSLIPPLPPLITAIIDASSLILITAPFLYLLSFHPMVKEIAGRRKSQQMLSEREKQLSTITETAGDAIICLESPDIISLWNRKAEEMFGFTADEAVGKELHKLIVPERYREKSYEGLDEFFKTGLGTVVGKTVEVEALHRDGGEFPIELSVSAMKIGDKWQTTGIVRDITDRKKGAAEIKRQSDDLRRINDELSMLYKVSMAISRTIDLHKLLYDILYTILGIEMFNVERRGGIFVVEEGRMNLISQVGFSDEFINLHKGMRVGDCLCGLAAMTGEIVVSTKADDDPRHTIHYADMTDHGHVVVPLKAAEKVVGVLCLYTPEGVELSRRSIETLMSIGGQIGVAIENSRLYEETKALALHDSLTGLANRRYMEIFLERGFNEARRYNRMFSVILLDIDYFKKYNDEYGHPAGDVLLARIAKIISEGVRDVDLAARYGGEEFIVLLPEVDYSQVHVVAERLRMSVAGNSNVTISLGVSSYTPEMQAKEELISVADTALYQAKQKGRNRVELGNNIRH